MSSVIHFAHIDETEKCRCLGTKTLIKTHVAYSCWSIYTCESCGKRSENNILSVRIIEKKQVQESTKCMCTNPFRTIIRIPATNTSWVTYKCVTCKKNTQYNSLNLKIID